MVYDMWTFIVTPVYEWHVNQSVYVGGTEHVGQCKRAQIVYLHIVKFP